MLLYIDSLPLSPSSLLTTVLPAFILLLSAQLQHTSLYTLLYVHVTSGFFSLIISRSGGARLENAPIELLNVEITSNLQKLCKNNRMTLVVSLFGFKVSSLPDVLTASITDH